MKYFSLVVLMLIEFHSVRAAPFINLDFESVDTNSVQQTPNSTDPYLSGTGPTLNLIPGWTLTHGGSVVDSLLFNVLAIGAGFFGIASQEATHIYPLYAPKRAAGNYVLFANTESEAGPWALSQRAEVPLNARSLNLVALVSPGMTLEANVNGNRIQDGQISQFAEQTVDLELRFFVSGTVATRADIGLDRITITADLDFKITRSPNANGEQLTLKFVTDPQYDYFVEYLDGLDSTASWQPLANGPHNTGLVIDSANKPERFYRVRAVGKPPIASDSFRSGI